MNNDLQIPRVLITGGSGFIGTNAVAYLREKGYDVLNLDFRPPQVEAHRELWRECDILDADKLRTLLAGYKPDYVIHLAARTDLSEREGVAAYAANTVGVQNIADAIRECGTVRRVMFASSRMVCRIGYEPRSEDEYCPPNSYGQSKLRGEQIVRAADLPCEWVLVRPTSVWGPWFDLPYKLFFLSIAKGAYVNPGKFNPLKSFAFVGNAVSQIGRLLLEAPAKKVNRRTLYLCDYPPIRVRDWADIIRQEMHLGPIRTVPHWLLRVAATLGDGAKRAGWERVPLTTFRLNNLITDMTFDTTLLEDLCGPLRYSIEEGVQLTVSWLRQTAQVSQTA